MQSADRCPYLVGLYGTYNDPDRDTFNVIREYMNAGTLQMKIDEKVILNIDDAAVVAYSVLRALKALHEHGIVHHEVRPSNTLLNTNGCIELSQFGILRGE